MSEESLSLSSWGSGKESVKDIDKDSGKELDEALKRLLEKEKALKKNSTQLKQYLEDLYDPDKSDQEEMKEEMKKINESKKKRNLKLVKLRQENEELMDEVREEMEELKDTMGSTGMAKLRQVMLQNDIDLFEAIDEYLADQHRQLFSHMSNAKKKKKKKKK